jgi:sigma-B regulation protein RsbU (phosphoserine phosphatase)
MASTQTLMRMLAQTEADPGVMLTRANRFLFAETSSAQFVSMLLVELDPPSRRIRYASAGHPPAYLLDGRGRLKERLEAKGPALSIFETAAYASSEPIAMDAGDLLLLTTDGVFESLSPGGEPFGEHRMLEAVRARIGSSAERIAESVFAAVMTHADGDRLADDATIVVLKARIERAGDPAVEISRQTAAQSYSG